MLKAVAFALAVAVAAGYATGGRLRRLAALRFRFTPLVYAALVYMVVFPYLEIGGNVYRVTLALAYLCGGLFLALNVARFRRGVRAGLAVCALGWTLNSVVIAANGGMPLSLDAYERSGQIGAPSPGREGFFKIVIAGPDTVLRPLGDVIPVRPLRNAFSAGDLVLLAGMIVVVAAAMRDPAAPAGPDPAEPPRRLPDRPPPGS